MRYIIAIFGLILSTIALGQVELEASVDKASTGLDEPIRYSIVAMDYQGRENPDFSPLEKNFTVISRGKSNQLSVSNGKTTDITQWIITLLPKKTGELTIPAIRLGQQTTEPITINVVSATQAVKTDNRQVFIETSASPMSPYVQAQTIYTMKIYYNHTIRNPNLTMKPNDKYIMKHILPDRQYNKVLNGVAYVIVEQNYTLFPQQSGEISIPAPKITGYMLQKTRSSAWGIGNRWQAFNVSGKAITLTVKPTPSNVNSQWWLPAKSISIKESWSQDLSNVHAGTPITRTIVIKANGVMGLQLPNLPNVSIPNVQTYPDKPAVANRFTPLGVMSSKTFKIAYIPNKEGKLKLPAVNIPWWNTKTNTAGTASIPAQTIHILAATDAAPVTSTIQPLNISAATEIKQEQEAGSIATPTSPRQEIWFWVATFIFICWIITLILFWRSRRRSLRIMDKQLNREARNHAESISKARSYLKKMCLENNPKSAKTGVLNLAHAIWDEKEFLSLGDVCKRLKDNDAIKHLQQLDKLLYADEEVPWDGLSFWDGVKQEFTKKAKRVIEKTHPLPDLYLGQQD